MTLEEGRRIFVFEEKIKQNKTKKNYIKARQERVGRKKTGFLTVQIDPKNLPHSPVCFILQREELQRPGALLPAVLQVITNSSDQCCSVPAELMCLDTPSP